MMKKVGITAILETQLEAANATIRELTLRLESMSRTIEEQSATIKSLESTIRNLEELLLKKDDALSSAEEQKKALGKLIGKKNEKVRTAFVPKTEEERAELDKRRDEERKARGNNGARRNMHYEMTVEEKDVRPEDSIAGDPDASVIGAKQYVRYSMIPPRFIKTVYNNIAYRLGGTVYTGTVPSTPFQNSCYEASCIAGIAELRYIQSLPVERIVGYFQSHGFDLDKNTAHGLLKKAADLLDPLLKALAGAVKGSAYNICDETYHKVLVNADDNEGRGSRKGYLWDMIAPSLGLAYFFYDEGSRSEDVILNELENYEGIIQSDGLNAYKKVAARSDGKVTRLSCLQHCKRGFIDLQGNPDADFILEQANLLYANEHQHSIGTDGWTEEDNLRWRRTYAPPILRKLKAALQKVVDSPDKYPPKSPMHKSAQYFLNEFDGVEAIFRTGGCDLDTNRLERLNRYVSLSRRNSLFFGSHEGAERGALFYSLSCSCRLCGVDFFEYLTDVIDRIAAMGPKATADTCRDLLPDRWKPQE